MADKNSDPVALWQEMFREMQRGFSALASQVLSSPPFSKPANSDGESPTVAQQQLASFMERCFVSMNMPSRVQMARVVVQLQAIESQLNEIKALLQEMPKALSAAAPTRTLTPGPASPTPTPAPQRSRRRVVPPSEGKK
jgi:hypothetical protein